MLTLTSMVSPPPPSTRLVKSWSTSGDADDRPTEEVAFYYNKIAFQYAATTDGKKFEPAKAMTWDNVKNKPWNDHGIALPKSS